MLLNIISDVITKERASKLIQDCLPQSMKIDDPDYSVYSRYDFKSMELSKELSKLVPVNFILGSKFAFTAYDKGGFIRTHTDGHSTVKGQPSTHTVLFYLNDDYTGGELVISQLGLCIKPPACSLIIMDQEFSHYVNELTAGHKYVLRVDALHS